MGINIESDSKGSWPGEKSGVSRMRRISQRNCAMREPIINDTELVRFDVLLENCMTPRTASLLVSDC